jgi:hypothetical protein
MSSLLVGIGMCATCGRFPAVAHRCLRRLIFLENPAAENKRAERHKTSSGATAVQPVQLPAAPSSFALLLHDQLTGQYAQWSATCGAFVIVAIMENGSQVQQPGWDVIG